MLVSPTICNLKVNKMLVDGGAGLNLISPVVIKRLQIPNGDLEETGTFQGVNPGRSQLLPLEHCVGFLLKRKG